MDTHFKIKWFNKIQVKISILIILITTVILVCFAGYQYVSVKSKMSNELIEFSQTTSKRLSKYLAGPMWAVEEAAIENFVMSEMLEKRIAAIIVKESDSGKAVIGKKRTKNGGIIDTQAVDDTHIVQAGNILSQQSGHEGKHLGSVEIYVTSEFMKLELKNTFIQFIIAVIILNIFIMIGIFAIVKAMLIKPITQLTNVAERTSVGDLNVEIDISSKDEIGALATAIDRMQSSLKISLRKLKTKK